MIKILNEGRGLTFHDWIDVYLQIPEECVIGNYEKDLGEVHYPHKANPKDETEQSFWMRWLRATRGPAIPSIQIGRGYWAIESKELSEVVKEGRGIGAWWNPKYIIICDSVSSTSRLGQKRPWGGEKEETEYGHPYWNDIPRFRRLRPFMENKRQLKFFFQLFSSCPSITPENSYITAYNKMWCPSQCHSIDLFNSELSIVLGNGPSCPKIIVLASREEVEINICGVKGTNLEWPQFYSTWHGHGWRSYREKFCRMICEK